jgi:energy-coupling factor transporter ATP-binding protein EcfA2
MGRSQFRKLHERIQAPSFLLFDERLYFYGSSGSGKSHILAALACLLIRQGKQVVYVPDCGALVDDWMGAMQTAFCFTFPKYYETIASFRTVDELLRFSKAFTNRLYIIVDQLNALEVHGDLRAQEKREATRLLWQITSRHHFIFSASANEQSNQMAEQKQARTTVIKLLGGMDDVRWHFTIIVYGIDIFRLRWSSGGSTILSCFLVRGWRRISAYLSKVSLDEFRFSSVPFSSSRVNRSMSVNSWHQER